MSINTPIQPGGYYHLYNRTNGNLKLFRSDENYQYFLDKYIKYVHSQVDTMAYCLLSNHFHFLIKVKESEELRNTRTISNSIKNWLISYTQAYNKVYSNHGNLFHQRIRRKEITDDKYFISLISYINLNPVHHGYVDSPEKWKFSSYKALISKGKTLINRDLTLSFFDGIENFKYYHDSRRLELISEQVNLEY